jgi:hypothetical protein
MARARHRAVRGRPELFCVLGAQRFFLPADGLLLEKKWPAPSKPLGKLSLVARV